MNIVLLSGGSGKRLWPLSNEVRSKQFIKIFHKPEVCKVKNREDAYESMVQRIYRQIKAVDKDATITVATSKSQVSALQNQLGEGVGISAEPCRRDTFPAIVLAAEYLHDIVGISLDEAVVVCPVDPYVDEEYFKALKKLGELAESGTANLCLMGINPTHPSEKYGYVMPISAEQVSKVSEFKEKPDAKKAAEYIAAGGLWNGGVFAYKLGYVIRRAHELIDYADYEDLLQKYETLTKISFDYAVVEHEKDIAVLRFSGQWKDLGTWCTLAEAMEERTIGDVRVDGTCENVHAVNELGLPIIAMGLKDVVIAASPDGILVSDKEQSNYLKPFVDAIDQQIMFAEKSWGSFRVLDVKSRSMTILVTLNPGHGMNYHSHDRRDEVWTVISGKGRAILDGAETKIKVGDVIRIPVKCKHTVIAETELQIIEVQLGKDISASDKKKYDLCT